MTCMKAQSLITPFINDQLELNELQEFVTHVQKCPECREELEVYYALLTAMNQLNDDDNRSYDYSYELATKLERAQEHIIHVKFTYYRKKSVLIILILAIALIASVRYVEHEQREDQRVTESDFHIRRMFHEEEYDKISDDLKNFIEVNDFLVPFNIEVEEDTEGMADESEDNLGGDEMQEEE